MSDWKDKSDFDINKAVAELRGFKLCEGQHYKPGVSYWLSSCQVFNPCNNPSDAWPIIMENKISVIFELDECYVNQGLKDFYPWIDIEIKVAEKENPLRAAMIVYLEMNNA